MQPDDAMNRIHKILAHAWMVRNFLKHADEIQDDDGMLAVPRMIFDYIRALEGSFQRRDAKDYLRRAAGKLPKLRKVAEVLVREQPRVSSHTNFEMAALSLSTCVASIEELLTAARTTSKNHAAEVADLNLNEPPSNSTESDGYSSDRSANDASP